MLGAFLVPVLEGAAINLCDAWDPARVLALMKAEGLAIGGGPPYFFTSLLEHPDFTDEHLRSIRTAGLGGATVPAAVTRRLADLGIHVFRSYDARLGEHAAAVLRVKSGCAMPTLAEVRDHFDRMGVARQKWPEVLYEVSKVFGDYPRTASGKVQKHLVREGIAVRF
jgi:acyl-CoA synthetase (AMP-forming)/AMP-acid ligase II